MAGSVPAVLLAWRSFNHWMVAWICVLGFLEFLGCPNFPNLETILKKPAMTSTQTCVAVFLLKPDQKPPRLLNIEQPTAIHLCLFLQCL